MASPKETSSSWPIGESFGGEDRAVRGGRLFTFLYRLGGLLVIPEPRIIPPVCWAVGGVFWAVFRQIVRCDMVEKIKNTAFFRLFFRTIRCCRKFILVSGLPSLGISRPI